MHSKTYFFGPFLVHNLLGPRPRTPPPAKQKQRPLQAQAQGSRLGGDAGVQREMALCTRRESVFRQCQHRAAVSCRPLK